MLNGKRESTDGSLPNSGAGRSPRPQPNERQTTNFSSPPIPKFSYQQTATLDAPPAKAFEPIRRIGGETGWYYGDWLWRLRGAMDLLCGGYGFKVQRRDRDQVVVGDMVDCMRVVAYEPDRRLLFAVNMKVWGAAFLEFEVEGGPHGSRIRITAIFDPEGWLGWTYWHLSYPLHRVIFAGMLRRIVTLARRSANTAS